MLPPEEAGKIEALCKLFPEIQQEVDAIAATFEAGAMQMAVTPSASVKEKLMASLPAKAGMVAEETHAAKVVEMKPVAAQRSAFSKLAIAASWILLLVTGAIAFLLYNNNEQLTDEVAKLQQQTASFDEQVAQLNQKVSSYELYRRLKSDASMTSVMLASVKPDVKQQAEILWNKATGELYIDPSSLPPAPKGKQYQLWFLIDGQPTDAGMISLTDVASIQKMKQTKPGAQMFAITLEDEGGKPTPDLTALVVAGKVS
ncbi:anti-sigma factor [Lacibacter luteus]|uniref:Anti-sigma factor n=2 Tax=Lacibacter luteus TaxID=2508719 RepID=A0A4Q1CP11_9BACT|nr:anti-sigma factor [Lacibacter luteus]